jgi:SAM-dependent methyltransferase
MSSLIQKFSEIYNDNLWASQESKSGSGSELSNTIVLRKELPFVFAKYAIKSMLDIPCGDFNWMKEINLNGIDYIGADIVPSVVELNKKLYPQFKFEVMDITKDNLPEVDLVFVRDCLGHLSNDNVFRALDNIKSSGSKYILATSFTKWDFNSDIIDGGWRCINLLIEPFRLKPQYLINEDCIEGYPYYNDKCMILFDLNNLNSL